MTGFPPIGNEPDYGFSAATAVFQTKLSTIIGDPELERRIVELYGAYVSALVAPAPSPAEANAAVERYSTYAAAVAEAFAGSSARTDLEAAFVDYQHALQRAWATLGPDVLGFEEFVVVAQEMQWVASVLGTVRTITTATQRS